MIAAQGKATAELDEPVLAPKGVFGAHVRVALVNDGPVTIWLDTEN
jgi:D-Tyr-tRNAtyr deacylase